MTDFKVQLYHYPGVRSARVKWLLHEFFNDDFDVIPVDLYAAEQYCQLFSNINPNHAVPVVNILTSGNDSYFLAESGAIITFLVDAFQHKKMAPPPGLSRARADFLYIVFWACSSFDMALWQIRIHSHVLKEQERDLKVVNRYKEKITSEIAPQLLKRISDGRYICGEYSAADCIIGHCIIWAQAYNLCKDDEFMQYISRLAEREAFRKAFEDSYLFQHEVPGDSPALEHFIG
ncbi:glutathione S-transferase family protein (plasmid) [Cedecea neteri]|uniref:glutathione S-transferase family protein n=1 Tax=Cedecea neteri TaxID=158822 RepID=UPI00289342B2|nr:glutathione S-transferase family protein [Cedecea neteri]WNJ82182.1 glutathione S-transferase family protein [Cedecea neteri]